MMKRSLVAALLAVGRAITPATACAPPPTGDESPLNITMGCNDPADPATLGYFSNHFSLNVKNLTRSIDFYTGVFGYRHIFTVQASEHLAIAYVGHSQGGRNGSGFQTSEEMLRHQGNSAGLIEMIHLDIPHQDFEGPGEKTSTFGHIGITVPDIKATQKRLRDKFPDVKLLKKTGTATPNKGPVAMANGFPPSAWAQISDEERQIIQKTLDGINAEFIYVEDPDKNMIEIQAQH